MGGSSQRRRIAAIVLGAALFAMLAGGAEAQARPYFRSASSGTNGTGATTLTVNVPANTVSGDVMIAGVGSASGTAPTPPAGWTLIAGATYVGASSEFSTYYRVAGASEPASYTWTVASGAVQADGVINTYVGVSTTTPIQTSANSIGFGTSATAPSVTTTSANELVVAAAAYSAGSAVTPTAPGGITQRASVVTPGVPYEGGLNGDFLQASAGATPSQTFTFSGNATYVATQVALTPAAGVLAFGITPALPTLPTVTLNGQVQNVTTTMTDFDIDDTTASGSGWNVTVNGRSGGTRSAVFKQYCPNATCGTDTGPGYVTGGRTLPANSLTLTSTGASFSGSSGTAPTLQCSSGCAVDAASATKVASAAAGAGAGPWVTSGFGSSSLKLVAPMTLRTLQAGEVYRVNILWTLNSGP